MIPNNALSSEIVYSEFLAPDNELLKNSRDDYESGGTAIGDPSQGHRVRRWKASVSGPKVLLSCPDVPSIGQIELYTHTERLTGVSLAFDQNMNPCVAFESASGAFFRYFSTSSSSYVVWQLPQGSYSPRCFLDDKRTTRTNTSDVLLVYLLSEKLVYRQQRDNYSIERILAECLGATRIRRIGMSSGRRLQIEVAYGCDYAYPTQCTLGEAVDVLPMTTHTSAVLALSGWTDPAAIGEIVGEGQFRYRETIFSPWSEWTSDPIALSPGGYLQARATAKNALGATQTVSIGISGERCEFTVTTIDCAGAENFLVFTPVLGVGTQSWQVSNSVVATDCVLYGSVVAISNGGEFRVMHNGVRGAWSTAGTIDPRDSLEVRLRASDAYETRVETTITIGMFSGVFAVETAAECDDAEHILPLPLAVFFPGATCVDDLDYGSPDWPRVEFPRQLVYDWLGEFVVPYCLPDAYAESPEIICPGFVASGTALSIAGGEVAVKTSGTWGSWSTQIEIAHGVVFKARVLSGAEHSAIVTATIVCEGVAGSLTAVTVNACLDGAFVNPSALVVEFSGTLCQSDLNYQTPLWNEVNYGL